MPAAALVSFIPVRTPVRTRPARINGRQCRLVQASDGGVLAIPQTRPPAAIPRLNESDAPTRAARFLAAPDLSVLEVVPVRLPGKAVLRLQVSASGIVERVTLVRNDPAPKELIDGLLAAFAATRLAPAQVGDQPTASSVEVTVRFEPGLLPIEPDQN
jgi:hypothetical protein